ncbi:hypothetical protein K239x_47950 [Planctomycetes bacterium K23_9]|uniref:Uncharacterized protein n=1 Tax=Stieleria marina TaxID=1930275 RepID=A0A517P084_9BACT|nr:hypothetical protein K239x_47950 [Planctomycetes bacterium K23_9]
MGDWVTNWIGIDWTTIGGQRFGKKSSLAIEIVFWDLLDKFEYRSFTAKPNSSSLDGTLHGVAIANRFELHV